jgi:hypothetical protein
MSSTDSTDLRPGESRVGFVGLGAMGAPMALRLARSFGLAAYDSDPAAMARWREGAPAGAEVVADVAGAAFAGGGGHGGRLGRGRGGIGGDADRTEFARRFDNLRRT